MYLKPAETTAVGYLSIGAVNREQWLRVLQDLFGGEEGVVDMNKAAFVFVYISLGRQSSSSPQF